MILTCPSCGTQYVVKDGAIPPQGRQVRCASCGHSWRQEPMQSDEALVLEEAVGHSPPSPQPETPLQEPAPAGDFTEPAPGFPEEERGPRAAYDEQEPYDREREERLVETPVAPPIPPQAEREAVRETEVAEYDEPAPSSRLEWVEDDEFSPFAEREPARRRRRSPLVLFLIALVLIAAIAAAFWLLAPPQWREKLGLASASGTSLQLMMTHSDRQKLASGNELLAVSGRVINPTTSTQAVPPIRAELKSSTGKLVYSWTIPPPARSLPPGGSASFNSAELNVPPGAAELTVTLGEPKA